jgi:RNA polymerase sigma-70 factor, ECF subfamily
MNLNKDTNPLNSPQISPFPVEKPQSKLSINIDADNWPYYQEYYPLVYRRCFAVLHNKEDAEDMAHNVFTKLHKLKSAGKLNIKKTDPKPYLNRMATNMSINELNKSEKTRKNLINIYHITTDEILNRILGKEEQGVLEEGIIINGHKKNKAEIIVKAILKEQDETTRKIYFYYYHDDMTLEQTGELVGLRKSAVQKRIKKLEKQIKAVLEKVNK